MSKRVLAALNIALLSGIISFSWAARPDGEPTCTFKGGAYYASENVMYLESYSEEGSEIAVSDDDECIKQLKEGFDLVVERNTVLSAKSTILLPVRKFSPKNSCVHLYEPVQMGKDSVGEWNIIIKNLIGDGTANRVYLMLTDVDTAGCSDIKEIEFKTSGGWEGLKSDPVSLTFYSNESKASDWEIVGTYSYVSWAKDDADLGRVFGYAAKNKGRYDAGEFVRVGAGAFIPPLRAYLRYTGTMPLTKSASEESFELPKTINVKIANEDGGTTRVAKWNTVTGEITRVDAWFDLKGRKLNGKPENKGMFIGKQKVQK